ncbi:hypothetical protein PQO01_14475 [Lentisphaera marina]|uniref:hypothetical protein n=1 Tax=Lentisphaera marina TaxID=1111041 RepID=UPI0023660D98|nr:hypothetical protein [Lentisphaera marina]MDD7986154.1 hypothetical protein [Lentisphaera marina]
MKKILFLVCGLLMSTLAAETKIHPQHPRLLFREADLEWIREKCKKEPYASVYQAMKSWADRHVGSKSSKEDMTIYGFLYQIENDKSYLEEAKRRLMEASNHELQFLKPTYEMKYTYDLIYNGLDKKDQAFLAQKLLAMHVSNPYKPDVMGIHQICNEGSSTLAVWGDEGVDMEMLKKRFQKERDAYLDRNFRVGNTIAQRWGGWHRSFECRCWRKYIPRFAEMWLNATGEDTFDNPLIRSQGAWYLYHTLPGFKDHKNFRIIPDSYTAFGQGNDYNDWDNPLILAKRLNEGLSQWWWQQPLSRNQIWGYGAYRIFFVNLSLENLREKDIDRLAQTGIFWRIILYHEQEVETVSPEKFPEDAYHEGMGLVSMRSSWQDDAAFGFFHCGRIASGKPDDLDNNNFFIYRNGYLATDGWPRGKTAHYGYEWDNYRRRTIAHNLITVYDPDEPLENFYSQYARVNVPTHTAGKVESNDGGQLGQHVLELDPNLHPWKEEKATNIYKQNGFIRAFRSSPEYTYTLGDATESYSAHKLEAFTREFVFLKPGIFVVFDRVVSNKKEFKKTWHIHPMEKPEINGKDFKWKAFRPKAAYSNKSPLGWLAGTTLLPKESSTELIGGKGKECWVDGKNYHTVRGEDISRGHFTKQDEEEWKNSWRIDIRDKNEEKETFFLHVLQTFPDEPEKLAQVKLLEESNSYGVRIEDEGKVWELTFNKDGGGKGKISLKQDGKSIISEHLPSKVEDTYKAWEKDPRYENWIRDKRYRLVIPQEDFIKE